jgi:CYTH domain-containing protein/thymidylate kinase
MNKHTLINAQALQSTITLGRNIHVIAITGGPCSGKTTGLAKLVQMLKDKGYKVLVSPESATKLIEGGVYPWDLKSAIFQKQILLDTLMQEERFMEAAVAYRNLGHKVVLLCDRGAMDGLAYIGESEFKQLCAELNLSLHDICNRRYHAVMHLRTAALGAESFYTLENNTARKETPEEARELDQKTLEAWQGHHHPRVIDNSTSFNEKIERLLAEVSAVLGDPTPVEREDKFLIEHIALEAIPTHVTVSEIVQDYLLPANEDCRRSGCRSCTTPCFKPRTEPYTGFCEAQGERRVRSRSDSSGTSYFYTVKQHIRPGERFEVERMISQKEYEEFLTLKDPTLHTIKKKRLCFFWQNQFIEVDVFEHPKGLTLMEIEQTELQQQLVLPPFIQVKEKVTHDKRYSNRALAGNSLRDL